MDVTRAGLTKSRPFGRLLVVAAAVVAGLAAAPLPAGAQTYPSTEYDLVDLAGDRAHGQILWQSTSVAVQGDLSDQGADGAGATVFFDFYQRGRYLGTRTRTVADQASLRFSLAHGTAPGGFTRVVAHLCVTAGPCGSPRVFERPR